MPQRDDNESIEVVNTPATKLTVPTPGIEDVWDVALTGVISNNSKRAYKNAMVDFARYILERAETTVPEGDIETLKIATPLLPQVKFTLISEYREQLRERKYAPRTINVRLAALNALFKRMMRLGLIDDNPASSDLVARMRTSSRSDTEGLEDKEAEAMLTLCYEDDSFMGKRDLALFAVMIFNGLRRSEVIQVDVDKIRFVQGTPTVKLTIKRGKDLTIEFIPKVWAVIDRWLVDANITEGPVFRRIRKFRNGREKVTKNRLTPDGVYDIIKARIGQAGITKNIHPHSLRHTYATLSLLAGVPIQEVQTSMGHSSTDTTYRYYRAIEQVGRSPGRSIKLNWPGGRKKENTP
jgi:integrase